MLDFAEKRWLCSEKKEPSNVTPDYEAITTFQKGQASWIFKEVKEQDEALIINNQNKQKTVVI